MTKRKKPQDCIQINYHFKALNREQTRALECLRTNTICFLTGPPGTAKTFLATAWATEQLLSRDLGFKVSRPAVQQGQESGFLPGTAAQKTAPFLYPIYEAVDQLCGVEFSPLVKQKIEIVPLSMIRGRNIRYATFVIDEAQNLLWNEVLAICTRLGEGGQIIFCGDISQNDHKDGTSRLEEAAHRLNGVEVGEHKIGWYQFTMQAVVRHPLIPAIIEAMAG